MDINFVIYEGCPAWQLIQINPEQLGPFLPRFLRDDDKRPAAEQFNERYEFGGWSPFGEGKWKLLEDNSLQYPEDPLLEPLAQCRLGKELIVLYPGDFVAIIQPDRSFEVARLD